MLRTRKNWNQIMLGSAMLVGVVISAVIYVASTIGIGKAIASVMLALFIAAWIVAGIVLVLRGIQRM